MHVRLVLLAHGTAFNILSYKSGEPRPPELRSNKLVDFEIVRVFSSLMIMTVRQDGLAERVLGGNIHIFAVCKRNHMTLGTKL